MRCSNVFPIDIGLEAVRGPQTASSKIEVRAFEVARLERSKYASASSTTGSTSGARAAPRAGGEHGQEDETSGRSHPYVVTRSASVVASASAISPLVTAFPPVDATTVNPVVRLPLSLARRAPVTGLHDDGAAMGRRLVRGLHDNGAAMDRLLVRGLHDDGAAMGRLPVRGLHNDGAAMGGRLVPGLHNDGAAMGRLPVRGLHNDGAAMGRLYDATAMRGRRSCAVRGADHPPALRPSAVASIVRRGAALLPAPLCDTSLARVRAEARRPVRLGDARGEDQNERTEWDDEES